MKSESGGLVDKEGKFTKKRSESVKYTVKIH